MRTALTAALLVLAAVACTPGGDTAPSSNAGASALGVAERQAEYEALVRELDAQWVSHAERAKGKHDDGRVATADACRQVEADAMARDVVLGDALFVAVVNMTTTDPLPESYAIWGERITLLKELDAALERGCA